MPLTPLKPARVKGAYGKPWSKMAGKPIPIDRKTLQRLGRAIVRAVVDEAKKDYAKQRAAPRHGEPYELPDSQDFFKSFSYQISGESTIEVLSNWPLINQHIEGRAPYPMTWLTQQNGVHIVPLRPTPTQVIFRMAPPNLAEAWIHPGFTKHNFIQRGVKKGRERAMEIIVEEALRELAKGDPLR